MTTPLRFHGTTICTPTCCTVYNANVPHLKGKPKELCGWWVFHIDKMIIHEVTEADIPLSELLERESSCSSQNDISPPMFWAIEGLNPVCTTQPQVYCTLVAVQPIGCGETHLMETTSHMHWRTVVDVAQEPGKLIWSYFRSRLQHPGCGRTWSPIYWSTEWSIHSCLSSRGIEHEPNHCHLRRCRSGPWSPRQHSPSAGRPQYRHSCSIHDCKWCPNCQSATLLHGPVHMHRLRCTCSPDGERPQAR